MLGTTNINSPFELSHPAFPLDLSIRPVLHQRNTSEGVFTDALKVGGGVL